MITGGTQADLLASTIVVPNGDIWWETDTALTGDDGLLYHYKTGDGTTLYADLPYTGYSPDNTFATCVPLPPVINPCPDCPECPTTPCEALAQITDPITDAACITDEMAPAIGCQMIQRDSFMVDVINECLALAGKLIGLLAMHPVHILDQDDNLVTNVVPDSNYHVLVFDGIQDNGGPYVNSIVDNG